MIIKSLTQLAKGLKIILLVFVLAGCGNQSLEEAIEKGWSSTIVVNEIVDSKETDDATVVLFTAHAVDESDKFEKLGVAIVTKHSETNWEFIHSDMTNIADIRYVIGQKILRFTTDEGKHVEIPIVFGKLLNDQISSITARVNGEISELEIINTISGRYFYEVDAWGPIEVLDEEGEVIDQYG